MIIIGLLIGGILKGQELIQNARISSTIAQVKGYSAATLTFQDSYKNLPGDIFAAHTLVPQCSTTNYCGGGNGDNKVGVFDIMSFSASQAGVLTLPEIETTYFWKHLQLAGLIDGIKPYSNPASPAWGSTHPSNTLSGGGFTVYTSSSTTGIDVGRGVGVRLLKYPNSSAADWQRSLTPLIAQKIDTKMDDGMPDSGAVQADAAATNCDPGGIYQVSNTTPSCYMFFQLY
ncbi:MAG: hypothetical protein DI586_06105 [Micavibrio aeruginosavorus]|uniref:Prepilin-type cleavage/methylation domain-containing protein n=1 Tax=Micavibrio aeruginosavorus TaxID=349221 RepID=A0A2W5FIG0_9BACT|nr:MAG: hypothetical protein DI586_06105 [Micavibrio aeruginosavorus]